MTAQDAPSEVPKFSRASVLVRPDAKPEIAEVKDGTGDSSPELKVEQGCLQAPAEPSVIPDRPFQRGHIDQQSIAASDKTTTGDAHHQSSIIDQAISEKAAIVESAQRSDKRSKAVSEAHRSSRNHSSAPKVTPEKQRSAAGQHNAPLLMREDASRQKMSHDRRKDPDSKDKEDRQDKAAEASARKDSAVGKAQRQNHSSSRVKAAKPDTKDSSGSLSQLLPV